MAGTVVHVTGISGTGIQQGLRKYRGWRLGQLGEDVEVISLEHDHIRRFAATRMNRPQDQIDLIDVLQLPRSVLLEIWKQAWDEAQEQIRVAVAENQDVILTYHTVWYHLRTREYLTCVDLHRVLASPPSSIVCLIDDIFDVKERLSRPRGVMAARLDSVPEYLDACVKLLPVLDWRKTGILQSTQLAEFVGQPHFVLAMKHPLRTFHQIAFQPERQIIYVAHPISQIRAQGEELVGSELVREMTLELRASATVIEPTAIDELRFREVTLPNVEGGNQGVVRTLPVLTNRWPLGDPADLLGAGVESPTPFGEIATKFAKRVLESQPDEVGSADLGVAEEINASLSALKEDIQMQLTSRDHGLMSQADALAVYRPVYQGNPSRGVREEISFHAELAENDVERALAFILHFPEDEDDHCLREARETLHSWFNSGRINDRNGQFEEFVNSLQSGVVQPILAKASDAEVGVEFEELLNARSIELAVQREGTMAGDLVLAQRQAANELGAALRARCPSY